MSFKSNSSKFQAESTVNKLFANILQTTPSQIQSSSSTSSSSLSTTQILSQQFNHDNTKDIKKKKKTSGRIKKASETDKKFKKFIKYTMIKERKEHTPEEKKYLKKLAKKNINHLQQFSKVDDLEIEDELAEVKLGLLENLHKPAHKRLRKKRIVHKSKDFDDFDITGKGKNTPGLTPGLAPVDYNESDSE